MNLINKTEKTWFKFKFIGEGANTVKKGICANHLRDIEKFFGGAHLTYNARNEDEVDEDMLIDKLKKVGSEYSFKMKVEPYEPTLPVGMVIWIHFKTLFQK